MSYSSKNIVLKDKVSFLRKIIEAAKAYEKNLLHQNMLLVYKEQPNKYKQIEVKFDKRHFLHLTGVETNGILSSDFLDRCLNNSLTVSDFEVKDEWTTSMKMQVILPLMEVYKNSRMIGDFNGSSVYLNTEKLVGRESGCMGLCFDPDEGYFVPNTLLQEDIRDRIDRSRQLVAVYMKHKHEEKYNRLCYVAKPKSPENLKMATEIEALIVSCEELIIECMQKPEKPKKVAGKSKKKKR